MDPRVGAISGSGAGESLAAPKELLQGLIEGARIIEDSRKRCLRAGSSFGTFWMLRRSRKRNGGLGQMVPVSQRFFWNKLESRLQSAAEDR
jgi:hypothetical protein